MSRFSDRTNPKAQMSHRRQDSKRFWCLLGGSSVLIHLGLSYWVGIMNIHSPTSVRTGHVTPIDWVELPTPAPTENLSNPTTNSQVSQPVSQVSPAKIPANPADQTNLLPETTLSQPSSSTSRSSIAVEPDADSGPESDAESELTENAASVQAEPTANLDESHFATALQSEVTPLDQPSFEPSSPEEEANLDPASSDPSLPDQRLPDQSPSDRSATSAEQQFPAPETTDPDAPQPSSSLSDAPSSNHSELIERIATATPTPLLSTQAIDVPIPDVSGRLPVTTDPGSDLAANVTQQISIPSQLTASLTASSLPTERDQVLDEVAEPTTDVQTFSSNPATSPCRVTPEAVRFLGKTVAMQVVTNEKGEVVHTITQESSQSMAYDELAVCLVKNWTFAPAIARGQPVANDGLVVHITIDRS